mmetsp:Transcript_49028/g.106789  ORF Transcript_49028/g.106789 Transcript_49028/m.106789 type:complete len:312 (-) Transcript_49028:130-1065(-)
MRCSLLTIFGLAAALQRPDVDKATKLLNKIDHGLHGLLAKSKVPAGTQDIADKMDHVLADLQRNSTSEDAKMKEAAAAMADLHAWQAELTKKQQELTQAAKQDDEKMEKYKQKDRNDMLFNELLPLQDASMPEQFAVLKKAEYNTLPAAKFLLAHATQDDNLAVQMGSFLDSEKVQAEKDRAARLAKMSPMDRTLAPILEKLEARVQAVEDSIETLKNNEVVLKENKGSAADFQRYLSEKNGKKPTVAEAEKMLKFVRRRELHQVEKTKAVKELELKGLTAAVKAVKSHDLKGVEQAMKLLQGGGQEDFLH